MTWKAAATAHVPALGWLRSYERGWLRDDLMAGLTLAAYLIPSAIGDASLAGLPAQAGLYACLFSALVYWMFSGSRHTAISVTSAISLLLGSSLGALAGGDPARSRPARRSSSERSDCWPGSCAPAPRPISSPRA